MKHMKSSNQTNSECPDSKEKMEGSTGSPAPNLPQQTQGLVVRPHPTREGETIRAYIASRHDSEAQKDYFRISGLRDALLAERLLREAFEWWTRVLVGVALIGWALAGYFAIQAVRPWR